MSAPAESASNAVRTDKASAVVVSIFGALLIAFGCLSLLMVALQRLFFSSLSPLPSDPPGIAFMKGMDAIHRAWIVFMPLMIAGGFVFLLAGIRIFKGSSTARRVAQVNAVLAYVWLISYALACYRIMWLLPTPFDEISKPAMDAFRWLSLIGTTFIAALFPTGLLFILRRPSANRSQRDQGSTSREATLF